MRILIIIFYLFSYLVLSHEYEKNNIVVDHPILKINSDRSKVGAGYMKIINNSTSDVYFNKISTEISKRLEIHETIEENSIYKMRPVENSLLIPSGGEIIFKSKSYHVMFYDFNSTFNNNDFIDAILHFSDQLIIPIKFKVVIGSNHDHKHH